MMPAAVAAGMPTAARMPAAKALAAAGHLWHFGRVVSAAKQVEPATAAHLRSLLGFERTKRSRRPAAEFRPAATAALEALRGRAEGLLHGCAIASTGAAIRSALAAAVGFRPVRQTALRTTERLRLRPAIRLRPADRRRGYMPPSARGYRTEPRGSAHPHTGCLKAALAIVHSPVHNSRQLHTPSAHSHRGLRPQRHNSRPAADPNSPPWCYASSSPSG